MRKLVIPDVHLDLWTVEEILKTEHFDRVIFLGDYFNSSFKFQNELGDNIKMATWLREKLRDPRFIFLLGNHEWAYRYPKLKHFCSKFTEHKSWVINSILLPSDWAKFKFVHYEDEILYSHSGVRGEFLNDILDDKPSYANEDSYLFYKAGSINQELEELLGSDSKLGLLNPKFYSFFVRNFVCKFRGTDKVSQIYGHRPYFYPLVERNKRGRFNVGLDTDLRYYMVIDNDEAFVKESPSKIIEIPSYAELTEAARNYLHGEVIG
jgi:hypothetical protein